MIMLPDHEKQTACETMRRFGGEESRIMAYGDGKVGRLKSQLLE